MKSVQLKDLCNMKSGGTPSRKNADFYGGDIPWAKISDLESSPDGYIYDSEEHLTKEGLEAINNRCFNAGTLFLAMYGSVGKTAISKIPMTTNQAILGINIKKEAPLDINYLQFWFKTIKQRLLNRAVGGTLQNISLGIVKELKIPLPPLDQQKKIATILDTADAYRQKTKALIDKYDELTQSLFLDMFGDPVTNPMGWEEYLMNEACTKVTDGTHDTPDRLGEGIKFITGKHVRPYSIDYKNSDYVTKDVHEEIYRRCNPELGDVLYTNIGVNLGTAALNKVDYEFSMKNVALLKPLEKLLTGRYLEYLLNSENMKSKIVWMASLGGAQQFLSLTQLRRLKINIPPKELQNQFAKRVQAIEAQKALAEASLNQAEDLFNSLIQRAFKGELT